MLRYCCYQEAKPADKDLSGVRSLVLSLLVLFNYGLLVVDRIQWQRVFIAVHGNGGNRRELGIVAV